jgi:hypothetical protein
VDDHGQLVRKMLAVVEYQQHVDISEMRNDQVPPGHARDIGQVEHGGDRPIDPSLGEGGMELCDPDTVGEPIGEGLGGFDSEPALARPAGTDDGNNPRGTQTLPYSFERLRPADE